MEKLENLIDINLLEAYDDELKNTYLAGGIVFDISAHKAAGSPATPATFASLTAALGTNGANIPQNMRKGGMTVRFIKGSAQSQSNKYVQYRLTSQTFSTSEADWECIEDSVSALEQAVGTGGSVDERIADEGARHYLKAETYTKTEVNGLVDTPHQEYVTVEHYADLPATGSADTIYRVSNWDGSADGGQGAVDATVYSEYAWDGVSDPGRFVFLCVKSQIGEVFDISVYNNNAVYADLAAALGTNGANVPESLRKGGMSVKFIQGSAQSSDNNSVYVQYRLMKDSFSTTPSDWQGVDKELVANSKNLAESGVVKAEFERNGYYSKTIEDGKTIGSSGMPVDATGKKLLVGEVLAGHTYRVFFNGVENLDTSTSVYRIAFWKANPPANTNDVVSGSVDLNKKGGFTSPEGALYVGISMYRDDISAIDYCDTASIQNDIKDLQKENADANGRNIVSGEWDGTSKAVVLKDKDGNTKSSILASDINADVNAALSQANDAVNDLSIKTGNAVLVKSYPLDSSSWMNNKDAYLFEVPAGGKVKITSESTFYYTFVKSFTGIGGDNTFVYATGYSGRVSSGATREFDVPSDAKYAFFTKSTITAIEIDDTDIMSKDIGARVHHLEVSEEVIEGNVSALQGTVGGLVADVSELRTDFDNFEEYVNIEGTGPTEIDITGTVVVGFVKYDTGVVYSTNENYRRTDYIPVSEGDVLTIVTGGNSSVADIAAFSVSKNYDINNSIQGSEIQSNPLTTFNYTVPSGVSYIIVTQKIDINGGVVAISVKKTVEAPDNFIGDHFPNKSVLDGFSTGDNDELLWNGHEIGSDTSLSHLVVDLPVSADGAGIDVGYAYINSTTGIVTVKLS